jgi:hypothetical protein
MKAIKTTYLLLNYIFIAWLFLSWLDVVIHNTTPGYEYNNINLLYLITKGIL